MSRELERRLEKIEAKQRAEHGPDGAVPRYYAVRDRPLTDEQGDLTKDGLDTRNDKLGSLSPVLTETEWTLTYCHD